MASKSHICLPCNKNFNSEQQWKAHNEGKKHKYNTEVVLRDKIHSKTHLKPSITNIVDKDVQHLRSLGISIPRGVNKVIKCNKLENRSSKYDISNMIQLSESCVLMEGERILGIYVDTFFSNQKCQNLYNLLDFTYESGGFVE